ncbi:hypothetical protein KIPB_006029 [Kipferlia bialata]|uniref:Kelch-type beta propeller n=1 Tax=Kipferlia bialata TaxID=797122 RepID=A0A391P2Y2_9EUKA|nr:hypothetical protein KIPB_006029 [Kipferlia bialata]|eukprot:g6029.t1
MAGHESSTALELGSVEVSLPEDHPVSRLILNIVPTGPQNAVYFNDRQQLTSYEDGNAVCCSLGPADYYSIAHRYSPLDFTFQVECIDGSAVSVPDLRRLTYGDPYASVLGSFFAYGRESFPIPRGKTLSYGSGRKDWISHSEADTCVTRYIDTNGDSGRIPKFLGHRSQSLIQSQACCLEGLFVVFGGRRPYDNTVFNRATIFDPDTDEWTLDGRECPDMPDRIVHAVSNDVLHVFAKEGTGHWVYTLAGGWSEDTSLPDNVDKPYMTKTFGRLIAMFCDNGIYLFDTISGEYVRVSNDSSDSDEKNVYKGVVVGESMILFNVRACRPVKEGDPSESDSDASDSSQDTLYSLRNARGGSSYLERRALYREREKERERSREKARRERNCTISFSLLTLHDGLTYPSDLMEWACLSGGSFDIDYRPQEGQELWE